MYVHRLCKVARTYSKKERRQISLGKVCFAVSQELEGALGLFCEGDISLLKEEPCITAVHVMNAKLSVVVLNLLKYIPHSIN